MPRVLVSLWNRDTRVQASRLKNDHQRSVSIQQRLTALQQVVQRSAADWGAYQSERERYGHQAEDFDYHLVVAPEYLFAIEGAQPFLSEMEKETIRAALVHSAAQNPKLILIPGTTLWKKSMVRPNERTNKRGTQQPKPADRNFPQRFVQANTGTLGALMRTNQRMDFGIYRAAREDPFMKLQQWAQQAPDATRHIARNTAFIAWGNNLHTHHKMYENLSDQDGVTVEEGSSGVDWSETVFMPGELKPIPPVYGLAFDLHICAEHPLRRSANTCDFHVILSASVELEPRALSARQGGYIIHADSNGGSVYVGVTRTEIEPIYGFSVNDHGLPAGGVNCYACAIG